MRVAFASRVVFSFLVTPRFAEGRSLRVGRRERRGTLFGIREIVKWNSPTTAALSRGGRHEQGKKTSLSPLAFRQMSCLQFPELLEYAGTVRLIAKDGTKELGPHFSRQIWLQSLFGQISRE